MWRSRLRLLGIFSIACLVATPGNCWTCRGCTQDGSRTVCLSITCTPGKEFCTYGAADSTGSGWSGTLPAGEAAIACVELGVYAV